MIKLDDSIDPDEDIDVSEIDSPILKILCFQYKSIFSGDDNDFDIHFFDKQKRFFFTFTDSIVEIKGDITSVNRKDIKVNNGGFAFYAPILRAVYVCKSHRKYGLMSSLFNSLNDVSEETGQPYVSIADPFVLVDSPYEHSANEAFLKFMKTGHRRPDNWNVEVFKQCKRFEGYGLQNFVLPEYEYTQPFQHYIYVPDSAMDNNKLAIKSLQANPDLFIPSGIAIPNN